MSPEMVAAVCDVIGIPADEVRELAARAVIDNPKNASKRGMLERAFFEIGQAWRRARGAPVGLSPTDAPKPPPPNRH